MPVVQLNAELSVDQLVHAVRQLPPTEFTKFLHTITRVHPLHEEHHLSARESELLRNINHGIPSTVQGRYNELIAKRDNRTLTAKEYEELLQLTNQIELLDAKRVEYLLELARLRKQPLSLLMEELGLTPSTDA